MNTLWTLLLLAAEIVGSLDNFLDMGKYHSYSEMTDILQHLNQTYHNLTNLYSIGRSSKGKELWVLEISAGDTTGLVRPNVKLIGNIHGNEPVGKELLLQLAKYLVETYNKDRQVTRLLDFARIHLLPSLNPDGHELAMRSYNPDDSADCISSPGRTNYHNFDLNRNFPDHFEPNDGPPQSETLAIELWLEKISFILSASLHGGALLANYPYDNKDQNVWEEFFNNHNTSKLSQEEVLSLWKNWRPEHGENVAHLTPDDDVFKHLASTYANAHPTMHLGKPCPGTNIGFPKGITNGAAWYKLKGGMQDFNYIDHGCMELTLEISCCKFPKATALPQYWEDNKMALLAFLNEVHRGIRGVVKDETGVPVANATLQILGRDVPFRTNSEGEFWRILLPHVYILEVTADGFQTATMPIKVRDPDHSKWSPFIIITLNRIGSNHVQSNPIIWSNASVVDENEVNMVIPRFATPSINDSITEVAVNITPNTREIFSNDQHRSSSKAETNSRWMFVLCIFIFCFVNIITV